MTDFECKCECKNRDAFVRKVAAMRDLQKRYFKSRSSHLLKESMAAERDVDKEIARIHAASCGGKERENRDDVLKVGCGHQQL